MKRQRRHDKWQKKKDEREENGLPFDDLEPDEPDLPDDEKSFLPEPYVWHVFECLAKAGLLLQRGTTEPMEDEEEEALKFSQIIHLDWKPANSKYIGVLNSRQI